MKAAPARTLTQFRNILFATDFSSAAARAVPYVRKIASRYDANLVSLHVKPPLATPMTYAATWPADMERARTQDNQHRDELLGTFPGIRMQVEIVEGEIQSRLHEAIRKNNTDLVVIGTRGRTGLGKLLLGSAAEEIFRTLTCPVLTVGPHCNPARGNFREILYATDFTSESQIAAAYAVSLAEEFQARLVLLHVIPEKGPGDLVSASEISDAAHQLLSKLVPEEATAWCMPEYLVESGDPADKILETALLRESDLIVLGVKPEKGIPGAATHLPMATAHRVVSHAICPVLTVRD
jgi:nucleotide-binding universal stress UspA family protein